MDKSIAVIICTEPGRLEAKALLLVQSLRKYGGELRDVDVYSFAPRQGLDIGPRTRKSFQKLNVHHVHLPLNTEFAFYPFANKALVAAYAEQNIRADVLVFIDTDMMVLAEPSELLLSDGFDMAMRPVDLKGIGVYRNDDKEMEYWQGLNTTCGVKSLSYNRSTVDGQLVQCYWNSGLIATRPEKGIFSRWAQNLATVLRSGLLPRAGIMFVEQSTLSATVLGMQASVFELPNNYNYPIHLQHRMQPSRRLNKLSDMVTVHYHHIFGKPRDRNMHPLAGYLDSSEQSKWVLKHVRNTGVYNPNNSSGFLLLLRRMANLLTRNPQSCAQISFYDRQNSEE